MSKTKIAGVAILVASIAKIVADAFDGGGFAFQGNLDSLIYALNGLGFYFLRDAFKKFEAITDKK